MHTSRCLRYKTLSISSYRVAGNKKKVQKDLYSPCPKAHRELSRAARTWAPQPYKDVHKESLSQLYQTSPCLILSCVICRPRPLSAPVSCIPMPAKSIRLLALTPACSPNSTFPCCHSIATILSAHARTHTLKKKYLFEQKDMFEKF